MDFATLPHTHRLCKNCAMSMLQIQPKCQTVTHEYCSHQSSDIVRFDQL